MRPKTSPPLKIILLGDSGVGKTTLLNKYMGKNVAGGYVATIGCNFETKDVNLVIDGQDRNLTLQLWDTAGQERFQAISAAHYRGAHACIFVISLTEAVTLDTLRTRINEFWFNSETSSNSGLPLILVANKMDQEDRIVHSDAKILEARDEMMAGPPLAPFFKTSAKTMSQSEVEPIFIEAAKMAYKWQQEHETEDIFAAGAPLHGVDTSQSQSGCC